MILFIILPFSTILFDKILYHLFLLLFLMLYVISVCMEDLRGYEILRNRLMRGEFNLELASTIARNLAVVHRETHRTKIGMEALAEMDKTFELVTDTSAIFL